MKLKKNSYFLAIMIIFSSIILLSSFLKDNDEVEKTKVIINYNKVITEEIENSSEVRVSTSSSNLESGIIILPVIDANKELILDAL